MGRRLSTSRAYPPTLVAVEELVFADAGGGGLVLDDGGGVGVAYHREGVRAAFVADQQAVALAVVAGVLRTGIHPHEPPVGVLAVAGGDALAHYPAAGVTADVYHLRARIRLLVVAGEGHGIELAAGIVAHQHRGGILPGDGGAGLDLRPAQVAALAAAESALGDQVQDAAAALGISRIPVLHRAVAHVRILLHYYLHHGRVELVFVAHRGGAALHVAHARAFVGDDERAFELAGAARVDAEVAAEIHRALHSLGDVAEGAVGEDRAVQRRVEVVGDGHYAREVLAHEVRVLPDSLGEAAEDDAHLRQCLAEGGADANGVEHGIYRHLRFNSSQYLAFLYGDAELVEGLLQGGIYLLRTVFVPLGGCVVDDILEVYLREAAEMPPLGRSHGFPLAEGIQTELQEPLRLLLLRGDGAYDIFVQSLRDELLFYICNKTLAVLLLCRRREDVFFFCHRLQR